jgi:outer membrane receptor protein involved in Fe transport
MAKNLKFLKSLLYALMCIILFILPLHSQTNGKIAGKVFDAASDEPLAGVNVIVKGTFLGSASDADGYFTILNVPPGTYEVEASMVGYKTVIQTDVLVALERIAVIDFKLEEATLEGDVVVVVAERDILNKEVSSAQQVITPVQIERAAGVNTLNDFIGAQAGITNARTLTIRGGSEEQTGTYVNGLSFVNYRIGKAEATVPLSALEQVAVQAGGFSAEYGNFRSGVINMTTKTGTKTGYHGSINVSKNNPRMKRFGKSWYDPTNYYLRTYFEPTIAFEGASDENWITVAGGDSVEGLALATQFDNWGSYRGWNSLAERYNRGLPEEEQATPMDLYLLNAWMHMIVPDFEKLEELYPEYTITDEQKQALRDHAHEKEGQHADYDIDVGFGGPIPFFSKSLGDATFFLSHKTTNFNYVQPVMRDGEKTHVTMLSLKSNITRDLSVKVHGLYRLLKGTQSNFPSDGDIPSIDLGGDTMPINNLGTMFNSNPNSGGSTPSNSGASSSSNEYKAYGYGGNYQQYAYHPTFWQPKDQEYYLGGVEINDIINEKMFWDLNMSYGYQHDYFTPKETRNSDFIINFGPFYVDEMPYGVLFGLDTVYYDTDKFWNPADVFETVYQTGRRHASKVGEFHENSVTQQFKFKFDFSNQYNRYNFFKTGVELNYFDIDNNNWRWWRDQDTLYELRDRRKPYQLGGYIQDQISLNDLEARVGVRFDYYNSGGGLWPSGDVYNYEAFSAGTELLNREKLYADLKAGESVVWNRWHAIDDSLGGTFLEKTKNHFTVSPRLGISFPVTENSKFWFNYGHFRQPVPYAQQFMYKMRFAKDGLYEIGNPNLEPPRTISYELGINYNLLNQYLIEASAYYKDVSGEAATVDLISESGLSHDSWLNNRWEDDYGIELRVTKNYGSFFTGWINFWYVLDNSGRVGSEVWNQDMTANDPTDLYSGDEDAASLNPKVSANISLHTPDEFSLQWAGIYPLGGWTLNIMPTWERGHQFQFNPDDVRNVGRNMRWPDYFKTDLRINKTFEIMRIKLSAYLDIRNVFNNKISWLQYGWAFSGEEDYNEYITSLHLPEYKNRRVFDGDEYIVGNDELGDFRSKDKPYINDPDLKDMFAYGEPREIWFGLKVTF